MLQLVFSCGEGFDVVLTSALRIAQLPGSAMRSALKRATSPAAVNALSVAIANGSIETANTTPGVEVEGLEIDIEFDNQRLLATGGVGTAIAFGTIYWLGSRLQMQTRYAQLVVALETLNQALKSSNYAAADDALRLIDDLSNPLIDPVNLEPIEASDEVKAVFETVMKKRAGPGAMFNAQSLVAAGDEAVAIASKTGQRVAVLALNEAVEEAVEAMSQKAVAKSGTLLARAAGRLVWVDTVYWLGTSALDLGLNYLGVPEEKQRIPFLADLPFIGGLFDVSDSLGASGIDLLITGVFDAIYSFFGLEDEAEALVETLWSIILSAALNPAIAPFIIAILDFYVDEVNINFNLDLLFQANANVDVQVDLLRMVKFEPIDILILFTYAIIGKVFWKAWVIPAWSYVKR